MAEGKSQRRTSARTLASAAVCKGPECPICEDIILDESGYGKGDGEDAIFCFCEGECQAWLHRRCAGLSRPVFVGLSRGKDKPYFCPHCKLGSVMAKFEGMEAELASLKKELGNCRDRQTAASESAASVVAAANHRTLASEQDHQELKKVISKTASAMETQERAIELHDRALRRNNVVVFGVKESEEKTPSLIKGIIEKKMNVDSAKLRLGECFRIGKRSEGQDRPILLKCHDRESKEMLMLRRKELKGTGIYLNDDWTQVQRRKFQELKKRMVEAREDGNGPCFISRGILFIDAEKYNSVDSFVSADENCFI